MTEQNEKVKQAERRVTDELANQAHEEHGSSKAEEAKEKRSNAEKDLADAKKQQQK